MAKQLVTQRISVKIDLLGQILLKKGLVNNKQLEEALIVRKKEGNKLLGDILIQLGFISEEILCAALASQSDLCYIPLERYKIIKETLKLIPKQIALEYSCVALEKVGGVLTLAMANPFNEEALKEIEKAVSYKIVCVIGAKTQIDRIIKEEY